jgi:hypothetical protein
MGFAESDPIIQSALAVFLQQLGETGWVPDRYL